MQPGWRIKEQERSFLFGPNDESVCVPAFRINVASEYLTMGQLPAHFGTIPKHVSLDDPFPEQWETVAENADGEENVKWQPLGNLAGSRRMEVGLLVMDHVARPIDLRHVFEAPLDMPSQSIKANLSMLGFVRLTAPDLDRIRLYHASIIWLLHGQVTLADPELSRFLVFAENLPYNVLMFPFQQHAFNRSAPGMHAAYYHNVLTYKQMLLYTSRYR